MSKSNSLNLVSTNLIRQNCFVRDCASPSDLKEDYGCFNESKTYPTLDTICDSELNAMRDVTHNETYPITASYVKSFQDAADYRTDLQSAYNSPAPGSNLGDIRAVQSVLSRLEDLHSIYSDLQSKITNSAQSTSDHSGPTQSTSGQSDPAQPISGQSGS